MYHWVQRLIIVVFGWQLDFWLRLLGLFHTNMFGKLRLSFIEIHFPQNYTPRNF